MSVPHALLALLSEGPKYGLRLQNEFESRTGEVWPLNVGQVYTTLQRLERDGLVETDDDLGPSSRMIVHGVLDGIVECCPIPDHPYSAPVPTTTGPRPAAASM